MRRNNDINAYSDEVDNKNFTRTSSTIKDPGVVGPIVWNLRKQILSTEGIMSCQNLFHLKSVTIKQINITIYEFLLYKENH